MRVCQCPVLIWALAGGAPVSIPVGVLLQEVARRMKVLDERVAGIDVHKDMIKVAIRSPGGGDRGQSRALGPGASCRLSDVALRHKALVTRLRRSPRNDTDITQLHRDKGEWFTSSRHVCAALSRSSPEGGLIWARIGHDRARSEPVLPRTPGSHRVRRLPPAGGRG